VGDGVPLCVGAGVGIVDVPGDALGGTTGAGLPTLWAPVQGFQTGIFAG
jgi:hypothetical protein